MSVLRRHLTYANVMATLALFVALTGGAYAVATLPKNSVGTKQLRKQAVTSAKIKRGSVAADRLSSKARKSLRGRQGVKGDAGAAGPLLETLPTGRTLKGAWSMADSAASGYAQTAISFPIPLASSPTRTVIGLGEGPTPGCPGSPSNPLAAPGNLCVYEGDKDNTSGEPSSCGADKCGVGEDGRLGSTLMVSGTGLFYSIGTWAVTAP